MNPRHVYLLSLLSSVVLAGCGGGTTDPVLVPAALQAPLIVTGTTADVTLLETTDLHTNIRSYDYFKLAEDLSIGFERTATLIKAARAEGTNTLLFDNGDTIQGTAVSDYQALINRKREFLHTELRIAGNEASGHGTAAIVSDRRWQV